jgi:hypothetical protein
MRAVFLDLGTVDAGDLDTHARGWPCPGLGMHRRPPQAEVAARIAGCEVVLLNKSRITRGMMRPTRSCG